MEGPKRPLQSKHFQTFTRPSHSINICAQVMQKFSTEEPLIKHDAAWNKWRLCLNEPCAYVCCYSIRPLMLCCRLGGSTWLHYGTGSRIFMHWFDKMYLFYPWPSFSFLLTWILVRHHPPLTQMHIDIPFISPNSKHLWHDLTLVCFHWRHFDMSQLCSFLIFWAIVIPN